MVNCFSRRLVRSGVLGVCLTLVSLPYAPAQESHRGRKYNPPPPTAHISVTVFKDSNNKPLENAAVIFHPMQGDKDKGYMELKTNEEGNAVIDVVPIGDTVRLQVIADGFQTYGEDYKIDTDSKDIVIRLKRPQKQYSTYEHSSNTAQGTSPNSGSAQPSPKQ